MRTFAGLTEMRADVNVQTLVRDDEGGRGMAFLSPRDSRDIDGIVERA